MIDIIKDYTTKRLDLIKLQFTEKSSLSAGIIAFLSILLIAFSFFIILFNFGIAFLIGQSLGNAAHGFLIVAGFYFVLMIIVFLMKKKIVTIVANQVIDFLKK
ncbi:phage holin family protein [Epilithonimonas sp.]|uniref:phage holin family protein n=1 Tax=Epilithonimonas sp. TaxID=2894511 RepID=UPI002FDDB0B8